MTSTRKAFAWSFMGEALLRISQPLTYLALSLLLVPEEFGLAVPCLMVAALAQVIMEFAFGKIVVQDADSRALQSSAHVSSIAFGTIAGLAVLVFGMLYGSDVFGDGRISYVLAATAAHVFILGFAAVPQAVLQRELRFQSLFYMRLFSMLAFVSVSLALAASGYSYWSLIIGQGIGFLVQAVVVAVIVAQPLYRGLAWSHVLKVQQFAKWSWLTGLAYWSYIWIDSLIVGLNLSPADLGIYRLGNQVAISVFGLLLTPLLPVFYSQLSAAHTDRSAQIDHIVKLIKWSAPVAIGSACLIYAVADRLYGLILSPAWDGIGRVTAIIAINHGFFWWTGATAVALRVMHSPRAETTLTVVALLLSAPVYYLASLQGMESLLWSRLLANVCIGAPLALFLMRKCFPNYALFISKSMLPAMGVNFLAALALRKLSPHIANDYLYLALAGLIMSCIWAVWNRKRLRSLWKKLTTA